MIRIGKKQLTAISLALVFGLSLMTGGCAKKAQSEMSAVQQAEAAASRAEAAATRAEQAANNATMAANNATMAAEKAERIFTQKMKK